MTRSTRSIASAEGRLARILFLAVPFAIMACGGEDSPSTVAEAAAAVTPVTGTPGTSGAPAKPDELRAAATENPRPAAFERPGDAYKAGEYRVATEMYRTKLEETPGDAYGHYMLGLSSWKAGDFDGAKVAFDKSMELDPRFAKSYFNQARVLLDMDRGGEALEVVRKGLELDSTSGEGKRVLARVQAETGDIDGALTTYRELIKANDADAWGLNNLGMLLLDRGDVQGSLGPLSRAVQVRPTAPLFLNNLGMALERSGHTMAALTRYELAVQHDSGYVKAVRNVERLKAIVTDTVRVDEVDVGGLAEQFRQTVQLWKVEVPTPTP